jgi:hypothetical protein
LGGRENGRVGGVEIDEESFKEARHGMRGKGEATVGEYVRLQEIVSRRRMQ